MEKFAIDLDKVLDEFEFNEDRAEQVVSCPSSSNHVRIPSNSSDPRCKLPESQTQLGQRQSKHVKRDDNAPETVSGSDHDASTANFYSYEALVENKILDKELISAYQSQPCPQKICNDVAPKLLRKKSNENSDFKTMNSYDMKLHHANVKPSVSNLFNSLNEYINASAESPENTDYPDASDDSPRVPPEFAGIDRRKSEESDEDRSTDVISTNRVKPEPKPTNSSTCPAMVTTSIPPTYQNILLPMKLEMNVADNKGNTNHGPEIMDLPDELAVEPLAYENTKLPPVSDRLEDARSIIDRADHVYENVYIGTDIPKSHEVHTATEKRKATIASKIQNVVGHAYENVDPEESKTMIENSKDNVYECIYIGNHESSPETTADPEMVAQKMTGPLHASENNPEHERRELNLAKLVFQNVQLRDSEAEKKVVGFSHIDDLSEEELNKYLADLEAEERTQAVNSSYGNVMPNAHREMGTLTKSMLPSRHDDEDANEAPIFENVTIGELPEVSHSEFVKKSKKFPIIDYSKRGTSADAPADHVTRTGSDKFSQNTKIQIESKTTEGESRKNKKTSEKMRKTSDNVDTSADLSDVVEDGFRLVDTENRAVKPSESRDTDGNVILSESRVRSEDPSLKNTSNVLPAMETISCHDTVQAWTSSMTNDASPEVINSHDRTASITTDYVDPKPMEVQPSCSDTTDENNSLSICEVEGIMKDPEDASDMNTPTGASNVDNSATNSSSHLDAEGDENRPSRLQTIDIISTARLNEPDSPGAIPRQPERTATEVEEDREPSPNTSETSSLECGMVLGKQPPFWVPDSEAPICMLCEVKFTVIKRRHHCRACGKVLCGKCCGMKYRLEYQGNIDSRVCLPCYQLLVKAEAEDGGGDSAKNYANLSGHDTSSVCGRQPNPNNPMEYCSTIPPLQQLSEGLPIPPTVMVPVGVLKREGSSKQRTERPKSVIFSDGIRPGCDLTELDSSWDRKLPYRKPGNKRLPTSPGPSSVAMMAKRQNLPPLDPTTNSYIPQEPNALPPTVIIHKGQISYHDVVNQGRLFESLKNESEPPVMFAINRNLYAYVKITNLTCCVNRICWNVTSRGLSCVGQDEIILLVETLPGETQIPKDLLIHINSIYIEAIKGNTIPEFGISIHERGNLLGSKEHAGFLFIRQTFQCLQKIVLPPPPFLVGLLVHRWETPWAKVFPLRLVLRLGAEYRYYPCPLVSVRGRDAVYSEIGHTIMKVLADFRNFAYTLPSVRGLTIHMQDTTTEVMFPRNRYDQVIRGLNNSNDHVLAFASNFSMAADSHLVCVQTNTGDESSYQTQAINIHSRPRRVTGASFVVINGALKSSTGLSAKSSLVEDGLMVQIMPEKMEALKAALKNMQDFSIGCGRQGSAEPDEIVNIKWVDNDTQFNLGVKSPIDSKAMDGVPSIRVHNGTDYMGSTRFIRWTEVFIIKSEDLPNGVHDPVDINRLSESIARATCTALVKLLDLLATAGLTKIAVRTTIHPDTVGYEAGSEGTRLPPIYMKSLDNELIQVLHKAAQDSHDACTVLELIFHILDD